MIWYGDMTNTMLVQLLFLKLKKKHILFRHLGPEAFLFIKAKSTTHFREWKALYCMSSSKPALSAVLPDSLLSHLSLSPDSLLSHLTLCCLTWVCCLTWLSAVSPVSLTWVCVYLWCGRLCCCSWRTPWLRLKEGQTTGSWVQRLTQARLLRAGEDRRRVPGLRPKRQACRRKPRTCRASRTRGTGCWTSLWRPGARPSPPALEADWTGSEPPVDWAATPAEVPQHPAASVASS